MLDPRYTLTVEPDASAVAGAVNTLASRLYDPMAIRKAAFDAMRDDRIRLIRLIEAIFREEGVAFSANAPWLEIFRRGAWPMTTIEQMLASVPISEMQSGSDGNAVHG